MWMDALAKAIGIILKSEQYIGKAKKRNIGKNLRDLHHLLVSILTDAKIITAAAGRDSLSPIPVSLIERQVKQSYDLKQLLKITEVDKYAEIYVKDFAEAAGILIAKTDVFLLVLASAYDLSDDSQSIALIDRDEDGIGMGVRLETDSTGIFIVPISERIAVIHEDNRDELLEKVYVAATKDQLHAMDLQIKAPEQSSAGLRKFIQKKFKIEEI